MENRTSFRFISALLVILCMQSIFTQDLKIEPADHKLLVAEGSKIVLDCYITLKSGGSATDLIWKGPDNGGKFSLSTRTDDSTTFHRLLIIEKFTADHKGPYICTYENLEATINLVNVIEKKEDVEYYYLNKTITLQCLLDFTTTNYKKTFQDWLKDNTSVSQLELPDRFKIYENGTLIIEKPARSDSGLYAARYSIEGVDRPFYDCIVTFIAAPLVLDMSKSKNVIEESTLELECKVKGYPSANITWLKDNETIHEDLKRIFMDSLPEYELLTVHSVTTADEGLYTCLAVDERGRRSEKSIVVRVKEQLEWLWPIIGIICEAIALAVIIFACSKIKKDDHVERPANEREGLLRQGSGRNRDHDKSN
jgi:hypothetical protein